MKNIDDLIGTYETIEINATAQDLVNRGWELDADLIGNDPISIQFRGNKVVVCACASSNDTYEVGTVDVRFDDIKQDLQEVINL